MVGSATAPAGIFVNRMASATPSRAAPATMARWLPAVATIVGVAALLYLVYDPWYLNYDARYALLWARDLWHGFTPGVHRRLRPHAAPAADRGQLDRAAVRRRRDRVMVLITLLCFGALVWLVLPAGQPSCSRRGPARHRARRPDPARRSSATRCSPTRTCRSRRSSSGPVLLEATGPKRGVPVLACWRSRGCCARRPGCSPASTCSTCGAGRTWPERAKLVAVALIAPLDLGLQRLDHHRRPAALAARHLRAGRVQRPAPLASPRCRTGARQYFGFTLREPLILGVPIGIAFAWMYRRRRGCCPVAVVVAMTRRVRDRPAVRAAADRPLRADPRVLLALFYGPAVCRLACCCPKDTAARRRWMGIGAFALLLSLVFIPSRSRCCASLDQRFDRRRPPLRRPRQAAEAPKVKAAFAVCAPLSTADHRPIPYFRFWLRRARPGSVGTVEGTPARSASCSCQPRHTKYAKPLLQEELPEGDRPGPATSGSTATAASRVRLTALSRGPAGARLRRLRRPPASTSSSSSTLEEPL